MESRKVWVRFYFFMDRTVKFTFVYEKCSLPLSEYFLEEHKSPYLYTKWYYGPKPQHSN